MTGTTRKSGKPYCRSSRYLVLELARQVQGQFPEESPQRQGIVEAAELLGQLLLQDVERQEDGPLKDGVSRDRIPSVHDPEMRHGRIDIRLPWWWISIPKPR